MPAGRGRPRSAPAARHASPRGGEAAAVDDQRAADPGTGASVPIEDCDPSSLFRAQAYRETMKIYETRQGAETLPASAIPFKGLVEDGDGFLVNHSEEPLFSAEETDAIVEECEARAARMGGWTTARHANYPTTDVPLQELPRTLEWFREEALPTKLYPFLSQAFGYTLPSPKSLRVVDAFVVKYNATAGQSFLKPHRDGSVVSFNIALNSLDDYEGGGTYVARLDEGVRSDRGHVLCHASGMLHGGHPITSGVRYILVAFVILKEYANFAYRFYERVRDMDPADKEPLPEDASAPAESNNNNNNNNNNDDGDVAESNAAPEANAAAVVAPGANAAAAAPVVVVDEAEVRKTPVAAASHAMAGAVEDYDLWASAIDAGSGKTYYYHSETLQTSWTWPPE